MNTNANLLRELRNERTPGLPPSRKGRWIARACRALIARRERGGWWLFGRQAPSANSASSTMLASTIHSPLREGGGPGERSMRSSLSRSALVFIVEPDVGRRPL